MSISVTVRQSTSSDPRDLEIVTLKLLVEKQNELIISLNHLIGVQDNLLIRAGLALPERRGA